MGEIFEQKKWGNHTIVWIMIVQIKQNVWIIQTLKCKLSRMCELSIHWSQLGSIQLCEQLCELSRMYELDVHWSLWSQWGSIQLSE